MTKERLEELINRKEWIWIIDDEQKCFGLKLDNKLHIKDNSLRSEVETVYATLNNIFETKERAEWALKTVAERTERFEPPMLQDIKDKYIYTFVNGLTEYTFSVIKNKKHYCIGVIEYSLFDGSHNHLVDIEKATKENYEKACEIVRDLFKGEK